MKSIIKRLKRRASPTTSSAPGGTPVTTRTNHLTRDSTSHHDGTRETSCTPHINSSPRPPPNSLVLTNTELEQPISHGKSQDSATQAGSLLQIPQNHNGMSSVTGSSCGRTYSNITSRVDSQERLCCDLSYTEETHSDIEENDDILSSSVTRASSIHTFGDQSHHQNQSNTTRVASDDSGMDATTYYEEKHTLKPVTHETIHKHIVEEVQRVRLHERHLTSIQHHVQPIITPSYEFEFQDYRIELPDPAESHVERIDIEKKLKLDTIIEDLIRNNKRRYETEGLENFQKSQSIELPDVAQQAVVVHNYHIIQPVMVNRDHVLQKSVHLETVKSAVRPAEVDAHKQSLEDTYAQQVGQLNKLVDSLQLENRDLKKSLSSALASKILSPQS
ncbi:hypothetical protein PSTT_01953 [Puccinia striiformis]|uniref:Uncharacterized protein n=1 Tax=Puccinia striiformis TaxID=27350 RepID=A0A2S4W225_9BASI|nr:hypothetical protein PSTT_01953 [Puccinia striiformis]